MIVRGIVSRPSARFSFCGRLLVAALILLSVPHAARAQQQILLDKPVRGGELILFPDLADELSYYYVVDKPKLATDANGRPQFSFLRYAENVRGTAGAAAPPVPRTFSA